MEQAPPLAELRLHQGTVWRWNRAIYDPASGAAGYRIGDHTISHPHLTHLSDAAVPG